MLQIIISFEKIWKVLQVILCAIVQIWWNIVSRTCFRRNLSPGLLRWSSLQTKEGQRHSEFRLAGPENCKTPSTTKAWQSDHREDYRSCALPFCSLVQILPRTLHSDWQGGGTIWLDLSKDPERRRGTDPRPLWLLVGTPSSLGPAFAFIWAEHCLL